MAKTWEEKLSGWEEKYRPINHPTEGDGIQYFQPFGEDLTFLQAISNYHIWTVTEGDDGNLYLGAGWHIVNRVYYVVTLVPWKESDDEEHTELIWAESEDSDEEVEEDEENGDAKD